MATLRKITGKIILLFLIFWAILILHKWFVYCWGKKFTQPFSSSGGRKILTGLKSLKGCISCYSLATGLYRIILSTRIIHPILYRTTERKKTWMILHALCKITFKKEAERHLSLTKIFFDRCGLNEFGWQMDNLSFGKTSWQRKKKTLLPWGMWDGHSQL